MLVFFVSLDSCSLSSRSGTWYFVKKLSYKLVSMEELDHDEYNDAKCIEKLLVKGQYPLN